MTEFCDVALPVPLDIVFTYAVPEGMQPVVGGRVLVPFRQQRMSGIVTAVHNEKPKVKTKNVISVLDPAPVLDEYLIRLGRWIADYYLAPIGEVFRTMLPLGAEFKRAIGYRITEQGYLALHLAGMSGSSARSQKTPEDQLIEFRVLDYLAEREMTREQSLRAATRASKALLAGMAERPSTRVAPPRHRSQPDDSHLRTATVQGVLAHLHGKSGHAEQNFCRAAGVRAGHQSCLLRPGNYLNGGDHSAVDRQAAR